jgi:ABC-2 type transport system permease protein
MRTDVTRLDLTLRRRSTIGYAAGMALYTLVVVALYASFKNTTSLDSFTKSTAAALFGVNGPLTSPGGWLNANIYGNLLPLIMLLLTIGYGATCLAGQDEDGTLGLITVLPIPRRSIVVQKATAMLTQAVVLAFAVTICVLIGAAFQLHVGTGNVIDVAVASALLGLIFGLITMAVGAATGHRGTALGVGASLAAGCYLLSSLATSIHWLRPARYLSAFYWSVGNNQITHGVSLADFAVLIAASVVALFAAVLAFGRADLN